MKIIISLLFLSSLAFACPKGSVEYEGNCAADLKPESGQDTVTPSDEKPSRNPVPAYLRENVNSDTGRRAPAAQTFTAEAATGSDDGAGKLPNSGVPAR